MAHVPQSSVPWIPLAFCVSESLFLRLRSDCLTTGDPKDGLTGAPPIPILWQRGVREEKDKQGFLVLLIHHTPFHLWVSAHAVHSSNSISPLPFTWMPCAHPSRLQHRPHLLQEVSLTGPAPPARLHSPFHGSNFIFVTDSLIVCPLQDKVLRGQSVSHSAVSDSL